MAYVPVAQPQLVGAEHDMESQPTAYEGAAGRKSFDEINVHEVSPGETTPRSGTLRWSDPNTDASKTEKDRLSRESSLKSKTVSTFSKTGTWTLEIISLLIAAAAVAGIVGTLGHFDGRALPDWPFDITLSALIALLATIANANLAVPLQSGLSQLKWIRFKAGRAPLSDMEIYDEASRGTWGALKLLVKARGGFYGSFGAVLTIIALTLGPFAQQVASYRSHMVQSLNGASIPRALNYTGYLPGLSSSNGFVPILPMKSAVYAGLFAENNNPSAALNVTCSTGNCTFEPFETLAICSSCVDMTQYMTRYCEDGVPPNGNISGCGWQLPGGAALLNTSSEVFSMTSTFPSSFGDMPYATVMQLIFMGTESQSVPDVLNPWATECTLAACIQTVSSAVSDGYLSENVTGSFLNGTIVDVSGATSDVPIDLTSPETNETFTLAMGSKLAMEAWFADIFKNGSASRNGAYINQTFSDSNVIVNLTVGISSGETFFDSDVVTAFYWNYYEYPNGLALLMDDLAISMTVAVRSFVGAVPHSGLALSYESFVHVRWAFITVPVAILLLTALFLAAAIWRSQRSRTKLWKSSALAMLFHGLDHDTREKLGNGGTLKEKMMRAKDVKVQLDEQGDAGSLLRV